ncbi:MAG: RNA polymerase II transcriptional preinitiation complex assembly [Marteilia pararefringens]
MYEIYRSTLLGTSLVDSLDSLLYENKLTPQVNQKILKIFDSEMNIALTTKSKTKMNFNGKINCYRYFNEVWTFVIDDIYFSEMQNHLGCERIKIVSCDAKGL